MSIDKGNKKILIIGDHPKFPSGVGIQLKHIALGLKDKGYNITVLGSLSEKEGGMEVEEWKGIKLYTSEGYGNQTILRNIMTTEDPDMLMLFTDPRRFVWTWAMEAEIRERMPIVYYNLWDDSPTPKYNKQFYKGCDALFQINKQTNIFIDDILSDDEEVILDKEEDVENIIGKYNK